MSPTSSIVCRHLVEQCVLHSSLSRFRPCSFSRSGLSRLIFPCVVCVPSVARFFLCIDYPEGTRSLVYELGISKHSARSGVPSTLQARAVSRHSILIPCSLFSCPRTMRFIPSASQLFTTSYERLTVLSTDLQPTCNTGYIATCPPTGACICLVSIEGPTRGRQQRG